MATLANAKHELFAQGVAGGKTQEEAYKAAGYTGDRTAACRLATNVNVQARISELQGRGAERAATTVERLLDEGWALIGAAKADADYGAASQTLERVAKIAGLWVEKTKTDLNVRSHEDALADLDT
jgi:hypothetical protein